MDKESILKAAIEAVEPYGGIQPQPVPTAVKIAPWEDFIEVTFTTPVGQGIYFLDPGSAEEVADGLLKMVHEMKGEGDALPIMDS